MAILIPLGLFALLMALISIVGYRHYARPGRVFDQVGSAGAPGGIEIPDLYAGALREGAMVRIIRLVGEKVPVSPQDVVFTRRCLISAGYRSDGALWVLYGLKAIMGVLFVLAGIPLRTSVAPAGMLQLVFVAIAGVVGYFIPSWFLDLKVSARQERLKFALPDALDLMVVCVEAGLGLDQTIVNVAKELRLAHPDMADELSMVTLEMQAGKRRMEAMRNLAERTGVI